MKRNTFSLEQRTSAAHLGRLHSNLFCPKRGSVMGEGREVLHFFIFAATRAELPLLKTAEGEMG